VLHEVDQAACRLDTWRQQASQHADSGYSCRSFKGRSCSGCCQYVALAGDFCSSQREAGLPEGTGTCKAKEETRAAACIEQTTLSSHPSRHSIRARTSGCTRTRWFAQPGAVRVAGRVSAGRGPAADPPSRVGFGSNGADGGVRAGRAGSQGVLRLDRPEPPCVTTDRCRRRARHAAHVTGPKSKFEGNPAQGLKWRVQTMSR
jgi:hypothetical protein